MNEEFVFNIWFIVDIGTNLSTHCIIRSYNMATTDEEKLNVLHFLAETDYKSGERIHFSEKCKDLYANGQEADGYAHLSILKSYFELNFEFFARKAEDQLPLLFKFSGDLFAENKTIKQSLPKSPLFVMTMLFENEFGDLKPYTTKTNIAWIESQRIRINDISN